MDRLGHGYPSSQRQGSVRADLGVRGGFRYEERTAGGEEGKKEGWGHTL